MFNTNIPFGPYKCSISHLGIAVENADGKMVSYDKNKKEIVDVTPLNFSNQNIVYAIPVAIKDITVGDTILHNGKPVFVTSIEGGIKVTDVAASENKEILPVKNMFGFDFVVKLFNIMDGMVKTASESSPFGNMMLPLIMMSEDNSTSMSDVLTMSILCGNSNFDLSNPITLMLLMGNKKGKGGSADDIPFPLLALALSQKQTAPNSSSTVTK